MVGAGGWRKAATVAAFLAPSLVCLLAFSLGPMVGTLWTSLQEWNLLRPARFIGLDNYRELWGDEDFRRALRNTLYYLVGYLPLVTIGGLGLALLVNRALRGVAFFRTMYFLPVVTSWVVVALLWKWLLNPNDGVVNWALAKVGITGIGLVDVEDLGDAVGHPRLGVEGPRLRRWSSCSPGCSRSPTSLYEAATIDGAGPWQRLRRITIPLLTPSLFFVVVISLINGFQVFDQVWVMTEGGPAGASTVVVEQIVRNTFSYGRAGYASAQSVVLFVIILAVTAGAAPPAEALGPL